MPLFSHQIEFDRKRLLERATRLASTWRWRHALVLYRQLLAAEPHDPVLHAQAAPLLARSGRLYEARESFRRAEDGYRRLGNKHEADRQIVRASKSLPEDVEIARDRARFELARNQRETAMRVLAETSDRLRSRRGEAITLLREARELDPLDPRILLRLSRLLERDGQRAEALFWLDKLDDRVAESEQRRVNRLRFRIDPTFRNLVALLRGPRERESTGRLRSQTAGSR